jgi:hypothetical protein
MCVGLNYHGKVVIIVCVNADINLVKSVAECLSGDLCKGRLLEDVNVVACVAAACKLQLRILFVVISFPNDEGDFVGWRQQLIHWMKLAAWEGRLSGCAVEEVSSRCGDDALDLEDLEEHCCVNLSCVCHGL